MKKLNLLLIIILSSFNVFSQVKTNSEEQIKIEQYECIFPKNFIFTSKDEKGYNVTKNFTVEAATLTYKANKLISFTLKSNSRAQVTYPVERMISESSRVKQFWIDRNARYFVVLSFPVDIDNGMNITFISNINGSTLFDFMFQRTLTEREKKEQEILKTKTEKERIDKQEKDIKQIKGILSGINIEEKVSQIKTEIEEHYKSILKNKMINISARDMVGLRNLSKTLSLTGEFMLYVNQNKDIEIIKKITNCVDDDHSFSISDDKSNFFNREALSLKDKCTDEYKINGHTYYKLNNDIFTENYKIDKKITLEIRILRVNFKKGKFKYYTNGDRVPEIVKNWCTSNITTNGSYFINTIIIDGELTCNILNLDYETRVYLSGYLKQVY